MVVGTAARRGGTVLESAVNSPPSWLRICFLRITANLASPRNLRAITVGNHTSNHISNNTPV